MPELPEVETVRRELEPLIKAKRFARPEIHVPTTIAHPDAAVFTAKLAGRTVEAVDRRGKYLLIRLDQGLLTVHLRMTGNLIYQGVGQPAEERFLRVSLPFEDRSALLFSDMRRFGRLWLVENESELHELVLVNVGPDVVNELSRELFLTRLAKRTNSRLKGLLLDQKFMAGMGNIYTDECLHRCGLHPRRQVSSLSREQAETLYDQMQEVLAEGIAHGGTTFRDYRSARGALGDFQKLLGVYGRKGEACSLCGELIEKTVVAGRGTYYCPRCQEEPLPEGSGKGR